MEHFVVYVYFLGDEAQVETLIIRIDTFKYPCGD